MQRPLIVASLTLLLASAGTSQLAPAKAGAEPYNWAAEKAYCAAVIDNSEGMAGDKQSSWTPTSPAYEWRCAHGRLYICEAGADGVHCSKRSRSNIPRPAMIEECRDQGSLDVASGYYGYTWRWACENDKPTIAGIQFPIDKYGYAPSEWIRVK